MKKQFIKEAQRLQKLAGITEAKVVPVSLMQKSPYLFMDADGFLEIDIDNFKKYILSNLEIIKNLWNKDGGDWDLDNITQEELNKAIKTFQLDFPDNIQDRIDLTTNNPAQDYLSSWDKKEEIEILKIFLNTLNDVINQLDEAKVVPANPLYASLSSGLKPYNLTPAEIQEIVNNINERKNEYLEISNSKPIYIGLNKAVNNPTINKNVIDSVLEFAESLNEDEDEDDIPGVLAGQAPVFLDYEIMGNFAPQFVQNLYDLGFKFDNNEDIWIIPDDYYNKLSSKDQKDYSDKEITSYGIIWDFFDIDYDTDIRENISDYLNNAALEKATSTNEVKVRPQKQPEEKIPEGWKEDNTDVGEIYRDGSTIIKYYIRQHPASWIVPEYHRVYIAKRPNGEYYVQTMPSYNEQEYQSKPFSTFIEAKNYAFEDMNAIIDTEYDDYDEYEGEGPAYDEDY